MGESCVHVWPLGGRIVIVAEGVVPDTPHAAVTLILPGEVIRLAGTAADNFVAPVNVVVSADAPHCTVQPAVKFAPFTVSVKAGPPAVAETGFSAEIAGAGGVSTVKLWETFGAAR